MARPAQSRRRNFAGFGWLTKKQTTYQRSRGESSHSVQAYRAGVKSGDTGGFDSWLKGKRLDKAPRDIQKSLEAQYRRGVERAGVAERVKAAKTERAAKKKEQKRTALSSYKGVKLYKLGGGEYSTAIDKESRFDSLQDAKDFIASWKQNPQCARTVKTNVSDRAKRYRANQPGCKPGGVKKCQRCGSKRFLTVDHKDGDESNGRKSNLRWLCKSCNAELGAKFAREGRGRRTVQENLTKEGGAANIYEYALAGQMHDRKHHAHDAGGLIIHRTPKAKRREFAKQIWDSRYAHGTDRPGSGSAGHDEPDWVRNPAANHYALAIFDGVSRLGGKQDFTAPTLQEAQDKAQSYADDMGYDAVLYGPDGRSLGRFTTQRPIYDGRRHESPRRGNPEGDTDGDGSEEYRQAKRIAELFHGRPVKETITVRESIVDHDWFAHLGPLVELRIKGFRGSPFRTARFPFSLKGDDTVNLWTSPDGRQFYLRGGDQELDLDKLGMGPDTEWFRDFMALGEVTYFVYRDAKKFHRFKITDYDHKVGSGLDWTGTKHQQNTNSKPVMIYDTLSKKISFAGGQGKIETDNLIEGMSPGIVN